ncbi:isoleucine-tRNA ligase, partial [Anncaliia algerae PRA109]
MHKKVEFPKIEEEIIKLWNKNKAFEKSKEISKDRPEYVFYDGPPFATGLPHYGHILSGTVKDTIARFYFMQGYQMEKKFGWDCHGLPVEYEIDQKLNITTRKEVFDMGIAKYNAECKNIVLKYTKDWEIVVERMGRWIDFDGYKTMDLGFMESVWHIFSLLYKKDKVYKGHRVMPYSTACSTPLSNFEANQNYKEVSDPSILVSFPLLVNDLSENEEVNLVAWTTTPWTLPSNLALLVNKDFEYSIFRINNNPPLYVMLKERVSFYFKEFEEIKTIKGSDLLMKEYKPCFNHFTSLREKGFFRVFHANFVSKEDGTGIVHCAPGFGEDDYNTLVENNLITQNEEVPCPIDEKGKFTSEVKEYEGIYIKDADKLIINDLRERILQKGKIKHRYPFCWRSDTPLLYKLVPNWFIKVKEETQNLLKNNLLINWVPENVKYKKFHNWLSCAKDWSISRNRFWGTPIPLWECDDDFICIGSVKELEELSGVKVNDLHREFIDDIVIIKDNKTYKRVDEVFDCWFESGSMPYAQKHYPHNEIKLPADFIGEGVDQTRGWFYTLHVISTILFDTPAFKNCVVNGIVLAEDGKKMSKRLKNYPDPLDMFNKYGADAIRLYLISSPVVMAENLNFCEKGVNEIVKCLLLPWYYSLDYYKDCLSGKNISKLVMDDWLMNEFNTFMYKVYEDVKKYHLSKVYDYAINFID